MYFFELADMKFYKTLGMVWTGVALAFASAPAVADDMDVLGQFLEQNFPVQNDPMEAFALSHADQVEAQAALAGPLLSSQSALIFNNKTGEVLYQKNPDRVMPIASISKLMSAMVVLDAHLDMNEPITITEAEIDRLKGTGSRLSIGTTLTRGELLHLSLMSSENRATHALGRTYPGGMSAFVAAMNAKAQSLGMTSSRFYEPTGLNFQNVSTARDLNRMVAAASKYPLIRKNSTSNYGSVWTANGRQNYKTPMPWCVRAAGISNCRKQAIFVKQDVLWWLRPMYRISRLPLCCSTLRLPQPA